MGSSKREAAELFHDLRHSRGQWLDAEVDGRELAVGHGAWGKNFNHGGRRGHRESGLGMFDRLALALCSPSSLW